MTIMLPTESRKPLYQQVKDALKDALIQGRFENTVLPSSRALSVELGISRNTVNLAYQELVAQGLVRSEERVGFMPNTKVIESLSQSVDAPSITKQVDWRTKFRQRPSDQLLGISKEYNWQQFPFPFIYGQMESSMFPITAWNRALRTAMDHPHVNMSLQDRGSEDDPMLIEQLRHKVLATRGITAKPEEILITLGSQNGLFLACMSLIHDGDKVAVENPGYPDTVHIVADSGAQLIPVSVDEQGVQVASIPPDAKIIAVTPSHQFPTNVSLSKARRKALLMHAQRHDALIFEDDYDSELRYIGRPLPALQASDPQRVLYFGSFSKLLAPGLRLGFAVAPAAVIKRMREDRRYTIRHPPGQLQRALALLIESGDYQRSIRRQRSILRQKWNVMRDALERIIGPQFQAPNGGTSMWIPLPRGVQADTVVQAAAAKGVIVESGAACFSPNHSEAQNFLRLGYGAIPLESIVPGLQCLARVIQEERQNVSEL